MSDALAKSGPVPAWQSLRQFTPARIALGRAGGSMPTHALLEFRLAHARARDALLRPLNESALSQQLSAAGADPLLHLESAAPDLNTFLLRPDLGRSLSSASIAKLEPFAASKPDLVIVISDGLSTLAVESHAADVVRDLLPLLNADDWKLGPTCVIRRGRVAIEDQVGEILQSELALILIGERPGLVSPDSLGAYLVRKPQRTNTDAQRNCVSNISALGLTPAQAAAKLHWLLTEARRRKISGVDLKDEFNPAALLKG